MAERTDRFTAHDSIEPVLSEVEVLQVRGTVSPSARGRLFFPSW